MDTAHPDPDTLDPRERRALRRLEALEEATSLSLDFMRQVRGMMSIEMARRDYADGAPDKPVWRLPEMQQAHEAAARSLRLSVALAARLDAEPKARVTPIPSGLPELKPVVPPPEPPGPIWRPMPLEGRLLQKGFVHDTLVLGIQAEAPESERENLWAELHERLEDAEAEEQFAEQPTEQLIYTIARDIGLSDADDATILKAWGQPFGSADPPAGATGRLAYGRAVIKAALDALGPMKAQTRQALKAAQLERERSG